MSSLTDLQTSLSLLYMYTPQGHRIQRPSGNIDFTFMGNGAPHIYSGAGNVSAVSTEWQAAFREAFGLWSDVANLNFREISEGVPSASILRIGGADIPSPNDGVNYIEYGSNGISIYGELYLDQVYLGITPTPGNYAWRIAVHEIGHTLSLADISTVQGIPGSYETTRYSTMSYNAGFPGVEPATPMLWDIYAVQQIFGANSTVRTGDTTYGFNSNAGRQAFNFNVNATPVVTIWDAGGYDTIDLSGFSQAATVILEEGEFSSAAGLSQNIAIAFGTLIEAASGGSAGDSLIGNATDNLLRGNGGDDVLNGREGGDVLRGGDGNDFLAAGAGLDLLEGENGDDIGYLAQSAENDTFFGGAGRDMANYVGETQQITVNLGGTGPGIANGATIGSDTLHDIEDVNGGEAGDVVVGSTSANRIHGFGGNDLIVSSDGDDQLGGENGDDRLFGGMGADSIDGHADQDELNGGEGDDTLTGGDGNDSIDDGAGNDIVDAGFGNDTVISGAGSDTLDGGGQFDVLDMSAATGAIRLSLLGQFAQGGSIGNDVISGFERVVCGKGNDNMFGDGGINILEGGLGNDTIRALGGSDIVNGGAGFDLAVYELETGALNVNLVTGQLTGLVSGADSLIDIENVIGGFGADIMLGDGERNILDGRGANDVLSGGGGDDQLFGGGGRDRLNGMGNSDHLTGGAGIDTLAGGAGNDALLGGADNDLLFGGIGNDVLKGGAGADEFTGGAGADRYTLLSILDSGLVQADRDVIVDFNRAQGDRIDLLQIDARSGTAGNQAFDFIGTAGFSSNGAELRFSQRNGHTFVFGNTDGDSAAEFSLKLNGLHALAAGDFVL